MTPLDLFPETQPKATPITTEWQGKTLDKWGSPRITVRLIATWREPEGIWLCGWFVMLDRALDEWHPGAPDKHKAHASYPWYRTDVLPCSKHFDIAAAQAARGAKIVLAQMLPYAVDAEILADADEVSQTLERQAREWLTC